MLYKLFSVPIIAFSVIVMLFFPGNAYSKENPVSKNKSRIVVLDLRANGVPETVAKMATVIIQSELINNGKFIVLERERIDSILKEKNLNQNQCADNECAAQFGRLMSANKIMLGEVSKVADALLITLRVVDTEEGISEFAEFSKVESESDLEGAVVKIVRSLSNRILYMPAPADIAASEGKFKDKIILTWSKMPELERYFVYRAPGADGEFERIGMVPGNILEDTGVKQGKKYLYKVRGWNYNGYTEFSEAKTGYTVEPKIEPLPEKKVPPQVSYDQKGDNNPLGKNTIMIGLANLVNLSIFSGELYKPDYRGSVYQFNAGNAGVTPQFYWFIINNFAVGLQGSYVTAKDKWNEEFFDPMSGTYEKAHTVTVEYSMLTLQPGIKYFITLGKFSPFLGIAYVFERYAVEYKYKYEPGFSGPDHIVEIYSTNGISLEVGINYFISNRMALSSTLMYSIGHGVYNDGDTTYFNSGYNASGRILQFGLGINIFI